MLPAGIRSRLARLWQLGQTPVTRGALLPAVLVFILVFTAHFGSHVMQCTDSLWTTYLAMSMIRDGDANLDEYAHLQLPAGDHRVFMRDGHLRSVYSLGTPLLCVPFVFALDKLLLPLADFDLQLHLRSLPPTPQWFLPPMEVFIASCLIALAGVFICLMGRRSLDSPRALLLVFLFAFCTAARSTGSRALWSHGPSMLALSAALYVLVLAQRRPALAPWICIPLLMACAIRPTNFVHAAILFVAGAIQSRRMLGRYLLIVAGVFMVAAVCWPVLFEAPHYGTPTTFQQGAVTTRIRWEVFAGHLLSPNRGLLVFTPVFLFAAYGIVRKLKAGSWSSTDSLVLLAILAHWVVISQARFGWTGGHCFGSRYFSDITPFFVYFLIPAVADLPDARRSPSVALTLAFWLCVATSFAIHRQGATRWATWEWNYLPAEGDHRVRVWDWKDLQFLR
ncbi:MAG: hypothetical protein HZA91_19880 [Verrucomicrobia bacterium]|nr:hypothetical protein [Verrucomicrobiota bacterium]